MVTKKKTAILVIFLICVFLIFISLPTDDYVIDWTDSCYGVECTDPYPMEGNNWGMPLAGTQPYCLQWDDGCSI